jgi:hypothetical protein
VPIVAGFGYVIGWAVGLMIWIILAEADLIHGLKGIVPGEQPRPLDGFLDVILLGCIGLGLLASLLVYARIWRRHRGPQAGSALGM